MTSGEYQQLTDFFIDHLDRFKNEVRAFVEVSVESLRLEIRLVADGVLTNRRGIEENTRVLEEHGRLIAGNTMRIEGNTRVLEGHGRLIAGNTMRIEENTRVVEGHGRLIEGNGVRIEALTSRIERLEGTVTTRLEDHEERLRALE